MEVSPLLRGHVIARNPFSFTVHASIMCNTVSHVISKYILQYLEAFITSQLSYQTSSIPENSRKLTQAKKQQQQQHYLLELLLGTWSAQNIFLAHFPWYERLLT